MLALACRPGLPRERISAGERSGKNRRK